MKAYPVSGRAEEIKNYVSIFRFIIFMGKNLLRCLRFIEPAAVLYQITAKKNFELLGLVHLYFSSTYLQLAQTTTDPAHPK